MQKRRKKQEKETNLGRETCFLGLHANAGQGFYPRKIQDLTLVVSCAKFFCQFLWVNLTVHLVT